MKAKDVLANNLDIGWPKRLELLFVAAIANCGDVVEKRVKPNIRDVLGVPRDVNTPVESFLGPRN